MKASLFFLTSRVFRRNPVPNGHLSVIDGQVTQCSLCDKTYAHKHYIKVHEIEFLLDHIIACFMNRKSKFRQHLRTHSAETVNAVTENLTDLPVNQNDIALN